MRNCLIVDEMHPSLFPLLEEAGIVYDYVPSITKEQVLSKIGEYEGIIVRSKLKLTEEAFLLSPHLRYVARAGSGKDNIDVEAAEKRGIAVLNSPEGNRDAVAEHTIGLILNLINKISSASAEVKLGIWKREENRGVELGYLTVGIIGYGHTGKAVGKRLGCFGCNVLAYDINGIPNPDRDVKEASLQQIQKQADIITLHIPLDSRNKHFVNADFFKKLEKPIWFINAARGEVVNTLDLIEALRQGKVIGAGLDVLENEKLASYTSSEKEMLNTLSSFPQVILTPHVAGWTHESYRKISEFLGHKIKTFYKEDSILK